MRVVRLLRGQVVIREQPNADLAEYRHIVIPDTDRARAMSTHLGRVLAMGPPALTTKGAQVAPGFKVGDTVVFHFEHRELFWTRPWVDNEDAVWCPQHCVDGVVLHSYADVEVSVDGRRFEHVEGVNYGRRP